MIQLYAAILGILIPCCALAAASALPSAPVHASGPGDNDVTDICQAPSRVYNVGAPSPTGEDTRQIQAVIDQALADQQSGKVEAATIRLEPNAVYRLNGRPDNFQALLIKTKNLEKPKVECITLEGNGSTLSLAPTTNAFYIYGCVRCAIQNVRIQADPIPIVEGRLLEVNTQGNGYADVAVDRGTLSPIPPGYAKSSVVGNGAALSIFHELDPTGFPNHLSFGSATPYLIVGSLSAPSPGVLRVTYADRRSGARQRQTPELLSHLPLETTRVAVVDPVLDLAKSRAVSAIDNATDTLLARTNHPSFGPHFFNGARFATIFVDSNDTLSFRNVTITGVAGAGFYLIGNRGHILMESIRIVPRSPDGLLAIGCDGIDAHNNQFGITLRNSRIEATGDDEVNLVSFPYWAVSVDGPSAVLHLDDRFTSAPIEVGDRFMLLDTPTGREIGTFTVSGASKSFAKNEGALWHVTFDRPLPAVSTSTEPSPTTFLDLDMLNRGAVIENNLFKGGQRNGLFLTSSAKISNNAFVGIGLRAIHYVGILTPNPGLYLPRGVWGDLGPVSVIGNTVIDTTYGLLEQGEGGRRDAFRPEFAGLTVSDNAVFGPRQRIVKFAGGTSLPISASHNRVIFGALGEGAEDRLKAKLESARSGPVPFDISGVTPDILWSEECAATAVWHLC
jgi:hypothetical protein